tara:strand:- start:917 stop:1309 length:393 start_codon:yes stop_codon:yes gene_type:complete
MAQYTVTLQQNLSGQHGMNVSLQQGDTVYLAYLVNGRAGRNTHVSINTKPFIFGKVINTNFEDEVTIDDSFCVGCSIQQAGYETMFMFSKNRSVNTSGIIGYYAETEFRNHSTLPAEIFATAVDYVDSSK